MMVESMDSGTGAEEQDIHVRHTWPDFRDGFGARSLSASDVIWDNHVHLTRLGSSGTPPAGCGNQPASQEAVHQCVATTQCPLKRAGQSDGPVYAEADEG